MKKTLTLLLDRKEAWNVSSGGSISTEIKKEKNKVRAIKPFKEE